MRVLYKWEKCEAFRWASHDYSDNLSDAYFIEIHKEEIDEKLYTLFIKDSFVSPEELRNNKYFDDVNKRLNPKLPMNKDCAYVLIDKNVSRAILCDCYYPYASLWNAYCPFERLYKSKITENNKREYGIFIKNFDELKKINKLIKEKNLFLKRQN
jgi:hypothetical protein